MLQKSAGTIVFGLLCASFWLVQTGEARADAADARSVSMGGATAANSLGTAYAPIYNPAAISGNWSMMLPGVSVGVGNNVLGLSEISGLASSASDPGKLISDLSSRVNLQDGLRLEATAAVPLVGYSGHPVPVQLMGSPVEFGLNLWGHGGANVSLQGSQGLSQILTNSPTLFSEFNSLQSAATTAPTQLTSSVNQLSQALAAIQSATDINSANAALTQAINAAQSFRNSSGSVITPVQTTANDLAKNLGPLGSSPQSLNASVAADGHLTMALSGKAHVFRNNLIDLSVGANLKAFIMPGANATIQQLTLPGGVTMPVQAQPLALGVSVNTQPLVSVAKATSAITAASSAITGLNSDLDKVITQARAVQTQFQNNDPAAFQSMQNLAQSATSTATSLTSLNTTFSNLKNIQTDVASDLSNLKMSTSSFAQVAPVGVGADLGVLARIGDEWTAGAALENLFVAWPGQETTTDYTMTMVNNQPVLKAATPTTKASNYDRTEPRTLRVGGTFQPKKVDGLTVAADVEAVFNGRPAALHLGVEKRFGIVGLRLGGQLGGIGSMITAGAGLKLGPVHADLAGGIMPTMRAAQVATGLSLAF